MFEIRTILRGGLGNQLFQIAASVYFAKKLNSNLVLDDSQIYRHTNDSRRSWSRFLDLKSLFGFERVRWISRFPRFARRVNLIKPNIALSLRECDLLLLSQLNSNVVVQDWFVNKFYPLEVLEKSHLVSDDRTPHLHPNSKNGSYSPATAAIHIRQGDFKNTSWGTLSDSWYQKGVEALLSLEIENIDCYSDDIHKAKGILSPYFQSAKIRFPEEVFPLEPTQLLWVLTRYQYFVSSNSTLSWWSSFLNLDAKAIFTCWNEDLKINEWRNL